MRPCAAGRYSVYGSNSSDCDGYCSAGYWCPKQSISSQQNSCMAGKYSKKGARTSYCHGLCSEGYTCSENSTTPYQNKCGSEYFYCPKGSGEPLKVSFLYYSTGGTSLTRTNQNKCLYNQTIGSPPEANYRQNICPSTTVTTRD